jgi:signal transduction histidine kinase
MSRDSARRFRALIVLTIWTVFGILAAGQQSLLMRSEGEPTRLWRAFAIQLPGWWYWAAVTPLVLSLGRRLPLERGHWTRRLPAHVGLALALSALHTLLVVVLSVVVFRPLGGEPMSLRVAFLGYLTNRLVFDLLIYGAILGVGYAVEYHDRFRAREVHSARLEAELAQAELHALKMQLHPHFLFNTLNTIGVLTEREPAAAKEMLSLLGDLLRSTLDLAGAQEVRLRQELESLASYLEIERMRFSDRLTVSYDVAPETLEAWVPNLVLQPLVENAVRYAIAPRRAPGRIAITATRADGVLRLRVIDDGPGPGGVPKERAGAGFGLRTTRARLERLYGAKQRFELASGSAGGTVATVTIPYRTGASPDHE